MVFLTISAISMASMGFINQPYPTITGAPPSHVPIPPHSLPPQPAAAAAPGAAAAWRRGRGEITVKHGPISKNWDKNGDIFVGYYIISYHISYIIYHIILYYIIVYYICIHYIYNYIYDIIYIYTTNYDSFGCVWNWGIQTTISPQLCVGFLFLILYPGLLLLLPPPPPASLHIQQ